jgi:hypothetical protein
VCLLQLVRNDERLELAMRRSQSTATCLSSPSHTSAITFRKISTLAVKMIIGTELSASQRGNVSDRL